MSLVKRAIIVAEKYNIYEIDMSYSCSYTFEFRLYRKEDIEEILMWESFTVLGDDFEEKYDGLDKVLNHLLKYGVMPALYNFYLNNENDQLG